jgi:hypothetical protein
MADQIARQMARHVEAAVLRATSRRYVIDWNKLSARELQEVLKFLDDLDNEKRLAVRRAQTMPWRGK